MIKIVKVIIMKGEGSMILNENENEYKKESDGNKNDLNNDFK